MKYDLMGIVWEAGEAIADRNIALLDELGVELMKIKTSQKELDSVMNIIQSGITAVEIINELEKKC